MNLIFLKARYLPSYLYRIWRDVKANRMRSKFIRIASEIVSSIARPENPKTIVVLCHSGFLGDLGLYALLARELSKREAAPLFIVPELRLEPYRNEDLAKTEGSLIRKHRTLYEAADESGATSRFAWRINLAKGLAEADGINYAPAFIAMLRRHFKCYLIDFSDSSVQRVIADLVRSADATLGVCVDLRERFASKGLPVRILCAEPLYIPGGVFNIYCDQRGRDEGMELVDFAHAYTHFYDVSGPRAGTTFAVHNITRHKTNYRLEPVPARFYEWLQGGQDGAAALQALSAVVNQNRLGKRQPVREAEDILERLKIHRASGGKVACLYGHMSFDLADLFDLGPAHQDMVDWLQDTIATLADRPELLLLVKPHIGEVRHKGNLRPNQFLRNLLPAKLPPNVLYLEPGWFNAHELNPYIDLGLVWRSTVALELIISKIPVIVCCNAAFYWRGMRGLLIVPQDRKHYHQMLSDFSELLITDELQERAALLLRYIAEETFIPLPYLIRPEIKGRLLPHVWDRQYLKQFLLRGDPQVDRVCEEILA
jgi:hypothetical protein